MQYNAPEINPYDPNSVNPQPETPPLDEIIRQFVRSQMSLLRVCFPAQIVTVKGNQKVDVQPLIQSTLINGAVKTIPPVQNCLVSMPMGAMYSIKLPIAVGDTGWCVVCDRSLDAWAYSSGGLVNPQDSRAHDMNDSIFIPGLVPFTQQTSDTTTDLVITNGAAKAKVQASGKFAFTNGTNELLSVLDQVLTQLITLNDTLSKDTVNTIFGPMQLNMFSTYTTIKSELQTLQGELESLKGG